MNPQAEPCPWCGGTDTRPTPTGPGVHAWACRCGTNWATTTVNPHLRDRGGDYAEQARALRWYLQQIITLAEESPQLTDRELRTRLLALAECAR